MIFSFLYIDYKLLSFMIKYCIFSFQSIQVIDLCDPDFIVTKSFTKMLKFFMTKEVAEKFTAVRSARNQSEERKVRFVATNLYGIMCGMYWTPDGRYDLGILK